MVLSRILLAFLLLAAPAQAAVFSPQTTTLANGLQVIVVENQRAPVVLHMLWYKVGAADEPLNHAGLAHFFEHMMFKGTNENPTQDFSAEVAALGGDDNAFTSYDYTAFFQKIHPSHLADVMRMEAARMTDLELAADDIRVEKSVVIQERAQTSAATPADRFKEAVSAALYGPHPYARPIIGWDSTIQGYTQKALRTYYQQHYIPNNAVLVVSGAVQADDVFQLAQEIYGPIKAGEVPDRLRAGALPQTPMRLTQTDADVRQPQLLWAWHAPSARTAADVGNNDNDALQVLTEIVNAPDGILKTELVHKRKLAVDVDVNYDDAAYDETDFTVAASPAPGVTLDRVEKALRSLWPRALRGISAADVARAKQRMTDSAALARDSLHSPAYAFGMAITTGGTLDSVENWPQRIAAVSSADVQRVAAQLNGTPLLAARLEGAE